MVVTFFLLYCSYKEHIHVCYLLCTFPQTYFIMKFILYSFILYCLCFSSVFAQSQKAPKKDTVKTKEISTQEVVVTATRQKEINLEVPLAVTVVPQKILENARGYGLDEVLSLVPGTLVQSRSGNHDVRVTIRGFGARGAGERSNAGTSRGIRFYQDGIPDTEPDGRTAFDLIDLSGASSIEVIRSNASSLWGNAAGGIVSISTIPTSQTPFISLTNQNGSFGFMKQTLRMGTQTDAGLLYLSTNNTNFEGWRANSKSSLFQFNAGLVSSIGQNTKLNVFLVGASNNFRIPGPLTPSQYDSMPSQAQNDTRVYKPTYVQRDERRFNRLGRIGTTLEHNFSENVTLNAMTFIQAKYLERSERGTFREFTRYHTGGNAILGIKTKLGDETSLRSLLGFDEQYQDGGISFFELTSQGTKGTFPRSIKQEGANNFGLFLQEELSLFDNTVSVSAGLRYDNITYFNKSNDYSFRGDTVSSKSGTVSKVEGQGSFDQVTPKLGITWRIKPTLSVYANIGGGVEVPAGNETDPPAVYGITKPAAVNPILEPIRSVTAEVGVKNIIIPDDNSIIEDVYYDIAAYMINVTNDLIPFGSGGYYVSAGESRRTGFELGIQSRFNGGLTLFGTVSVTNNKYTDYVLDSMYSGKKTVSYTDNEMPGLPSLFATARLRWNPEFLPQAFIETEMRHVGEYFADDANTQKAAGYAIFDVSAGINQHLFEKLYLRLNARISNITDEKYISSVWINPDKARSLSEYAYIEPGLPQAFNISVGLDWKF